MTFAMQIPQEMRKKYLERRTRDVDELSAALEKRDFEHFRKIGHQLKGNAATYGYDDLAVLGQKMEAAAEAADPMAAEECLVTLRGWVQRSGGELWGESG